MHAAASSATSVGQCRPRGGCGSLVFCQSSGLGAAPEAVQARLGAIQEKMAKRQHIRSLPQRFAGSKQLSRREMEIENALFQGTDRHSFLRTLYHQGTCFDGGGRCRDPLLLLTRGKGASSGNGHDGALSFPPLQMRVSRRRPVRRTQWLTYKQFAKKSRATNSLSRGTQVCLRHPCPAPSQRYKTRAHSLLHGQWQ